MSMGAIGRAWRAWVAFWAERERPYALAAFRIAVGLVVLADVGGMLATPHVADVFVGLSQGGLAPDGRGPVWVGWLGGATPVVVHGILVTGVVLATCVTVGAGGRVVPLLLGQLLLGLYALGPATGGGHDRLMTNALWLFVLGPATATWSVDARLRTGAWDDPTPIRALARRMAVVQLVVMYTVTGLAKQGASWGASGDRLALYHSFLLPSWSRFDLTGVAHLVGLTRVGTMAAWWWESTWVVLGLWLLCRHPRWRTTRLGRWLAGWPAWLDPRVPYVIAGLVTHGLLGVLLNLGPFSWITLAYYVTLFPDRIGPSRPATTPSPAGSAAPIR